MPYTYGVIRNVFVLRWVDAVLPGDSESLVSIVEALAQQSESPPVYIAIVPEHVRPPDDPVRIEVKAGLDRLLKCCTCVHLVLEGSGMRNAIQTTIAAGIFLLSRGRGRTTPHRTLKDALATCKHIRSDPALIWREAVERGLTKV